MPISPHLEAVLFDLDDTLHDDTLAYTSAAEEVAREIAAVHEIDPIALKRAYMDQADGFWSTLNAGGLRTGLAGIRLELWRAALQRVGIDDPAVAHHAADRYHACRKAYFTPFPGALELLRELRERGLRLGLITNGFSETHREKLELLQMSELFDAVFIADEVGMVKPDPQLFALACSKLDVAPEAAVMVGDRYERDIRGAAEAGLSTVWLNVRNETVPPGATIQPDAICADLAEVRELLESVEVPA